jgi:hypothetical protein
MAPPILPAEWTSPLLASELLLFYVAPSRPGLVRWAQTRRPRRPRVEASSACKAPVQTATGLGNGPSRASAETFEPSSVAPMAFSWPIA